MSGMRRPAIPGNRSKDQISDEEFDDYYISEAIAAWDHFEALNERSRGVKKAGGNAVVDSLSEAIALGRIKEDLDVAGNVKRNVAATLESLGLPFNVNVRSVRDGVEVLVRITPMNNDSPDSRPKLWVGRGSKDGVR